MAGDDYVGAGLPVEVDHCAGAGLPVEVDGCSDVDGDGEGDDTNGYDGPCLPDHPPRKFLPSQRQAMALLSMAVLPEDRADLKRIASIHSQPGRRNLHHAPQLELCATREQLGLQVHMAVREPFSCTVRRTCFHRPVWSHAS